MHASLTEHMPTAAANLGGQPFGFAVAAGAPEPAGGGAVICDGGGDVQHPAITSNDPITSRMRLAPPSTARSCTWPSRDSRTCTRIADLRTCMRRRAQASRPGSRRREPSACTATRSPPPCIRVERRLRSARADRNGNRRRESYMCRRSRSVPWWRRASPRTRSSQLAAEAEACSQAAAAAMTSSRRSGTTRRFAPGEITTRRTNASRDASAGARDVRHGGGGAHHRESRPRASSRARGCRA